MVTLTFHGHSCVSLEREGARVVIDPGVFSDDALREGGALEGADAVLVTHLHPDHVAPAALVDRDVPIWGPADAVAHLADAGVAPDRLHTLAPGDHTTVAGLGLMVLGGVHAEIADAQPGIANNGYLLEGVFHPGDAVDHADLDAVAGEVRVLLLPVTAPWLRLGEAIALARRTPGAAVHPIHDGILNQRGTALLDGVASRFLGERYRRVGVGESVTHAGVAPVGPA
ncbi:MBL fold metallo-hydrolase [Serinibacter salmoneus]|uniref:L-ascorbate metabolism protein UlaG (Beta-lactamase superfamily) n=1 Tax=Serinibacter salmoneus TaxID=556530 RepID=A0A2A9D4J0_9MICO|nr:MBL fold metallo-hydrolase [Serinibacter salmoneus]PFG21246.1 L-ascorbate metabolism protein UlaG (beta-lactamase superfamily) [Serinibacter salmoneus]